MSIIVDYEEVFLPCANPAGFARISILEPEVAVSISDLSFEDHENLRYRG